MHIIDVILVLNFVTRPSEFHAGNMTIDDMNVGQTLKN